jgi:hypothetical protein
MINKRLFSTFLGKLVWIDTKEMATRFENRTYWHHIDLKPVPVLVDYLNKLGYTTNDEIEYYKICSDGNVFTIRGNGAGEWFHKKPNGTVIRIDSINQLQDSYWEFSAPILAKAS